MILNNIIQMPINVRILLIPLSINSLRLICQFVCVQYNQSDSESF